jgi:hypothetical protein
MKPKPFWVLNHLTVPVAIAFLWSRCTTIVPRIASGQPTPNFEGDETGSELRRASDLANPCEPTSGQYGRRQITLQSRINDRFASAMACLRRLILVAVEKARETVCSYIFVCYPKKGANEAG